MVLRQQRISPLPRPPIPRCRLPQTRRPTDLEREVTTRRCHTTPREGEVVVEDEREAAAVEATTSIIHPNTRTRTGKVVAAPVPPRMTNRASKASRRRFWVACGGFSTLRF